MAPGARSLLVPRLRELFRLIQRLPEAQRELALDTARSTIRGRLAETDAQVALDHQRELAAKIAYLRVVTPKTAADERSGGGSTFVMRGGKLVQGSGESRSRVADGALGMDEAMRRNAKDFKRLYGAEKPKKPLFF
uniref:Uncharacterized protein n=1 Tax=Chlamydomonas euryale TaxID=1486919 RepID=A0A7R9V8K5_9CHLO|mmetsp:Transcript_24220/g.71902  ORF Transcript_24220/g.71902 Transcript_24220/m.71902 type:complete len:136 (+) Transcript_24220:271-678(+)